MSALTPGWAERAAAEASAARTETERADALGLQPRRVWRSNLEVSQESRMRGAYASGRAKRARKPLPPLFAEDVKEKL